MPSLNRGEYITQKWKLFSNPQGFFKVEMFPVSDAFDSILSYTFLRHGFGIFISTFE